ncbi:MAG: DUF2142 domain-containing protein [Chloroflexota bacterium]
MRLLSPERFVLIGLLAFGLITSLATPLSAGYDEETHFIRAWEMAHLHFVPNEQLGAKLPFPALYWDLSYRRQPIVDAVEPGFWSKYGALRMDARDYVYANVETRSVYSPVLLLPQALALRYLGLSLRLPALAVYYACRIAGLLSYLLLCWLAVRLIPYGKWPLAILIVSPMAVFQASTISADTISNGIGFFFLGASLAVATAKAMAWKQWLTLLALLALLFVAKVNLIFLGLLPFLLLSPSRFRMRHGYALLAAAALALLLAEVIGWNFVAYSRFTRALEGANPREQLVFILANPLLFVKIIARDIWINTPAYMRGWVGVYGYNYWPVPALAYVLYPLAAVLSLWNRDPQSIPDKRTRIVLVSLFVVGFLLTIISLYVAFTPARSLFVAGVQGRYFTVVMPLLFLALLGPGTGIAESTTERSPRSLTAPSAALATAALALYAAGLLLSYHVPCGSEYYRWSRCYQPQYKNWAPESVSSPPVSQTLILTQEIVAACDGMTELSVWVNSRGADPAGNTTLTLRAPTQERDLIEDTFKNTDILQPGWLTVTFPPEWNSEDQLYLLKLTGSTSDGIRVGYSEKPEYLKGKLLENGTALGQDILFQYGCIAGLQRTLEALSAPAQRLR